MYKVSALTCALIHNLDKNLERGVLGAYYPKAVGKMWEGCVSCMQSAKSL